jgi:hypothetical protein
MASSGRGGGAPGKGNPGGERGGNRAGEDTRKAEQPQKSSQAAGKDPHRGERQTP